jgi:hypothetical protein
MLAGREGLLFSSSWLEEPTTYCVAEENENHGIHHTPRSIAAAIECYPDSRWLAMGVTQSGNVYDPVEVTTVISHLLRGSGDSKLAARYQAQSFLLFDLDNKAAILYSPYGYKLVAGEERFVRAYVENADEDPISELIEFFQSEIDDYSQVGNIRAVDTLQRNLKDALSQVKLPPHAKRAS